MSIKKFGIKLSWLFFINFFLFQWLFFRLAKLIENNKIIGWRILFPILPLTGWWSGYIFLYKSKNKQKRIKSKR